MYMPLLHLKIIPGSKGLTQFNIHQPIKAQNIYLRNACAVLANAGATAGDSIKVDIPWLAGREVNTSDYNGFLTIPLDPDSKWTNINFDVKLGNEHIPETFECQLLDNSNAPITATTNVKALHLYFQYETNSLF